jgi:spore maturation protein CgeB
MQNIQKKFLLITNNSKYNIDPLVDSFQNTSDLIVKIEYLWLKGRRFTLLYRLFNKIKVVLDLDGVNKRLLSNIKVFNPNIVFIVKGNSIYPWTLKYIKCNYPEIKLVSFSNDNMSIWSNKSIYYHFGINYYDLVVSINIDSYRKIEKFYYGRVLYIDKSYSEIHHKFISVENKDYDCLFIGSYEKERFEIMKYLAENGVRVSIYGNMWSKAKASDVSKNLTIHFKELVGDDYKRTLANAKVVLGFLRKVNLDTQTSRTFEVPACGGFMIMEYTENQDRLFAEDKEMVYFRTKEELLNKVLYYIKHQDEAKSIVNRARLRCETDGYEYGYRINTILEEINKP